MYVTLKKCIGRNSELQIQKILLNKLKTRKEFVALSCPVTFYHFEH